MSGEKVAETVVDGAGEAGDGAAAPTNELLRAYGSAALAKWQPRLRLGHMRMGLTVEAYEVDHKPTGRARLEWYKGTGLLQLHPDHHANFRTNWPVFAAETDAQLVERTVLHELAHVLEEPEQIAFETQVRWLVGGQDEGGVVGHDVWDLFEAARETRVNRWSQLLIDLDRAGAWGAA